MGKASQLSQLKASLASSGLSRTSQPGGTNGKRSSADSHPAGGAKRKRGKDEEKALEKIRKAMNPFEERVMRLKHDVGGKAPKGSSGRPGLAAQKGLANRQALLLPALLDKGHTASFVDSRFGENNTNLTPEEKMLERFTREKEREQREGGRRRGRELFNLGDGDEEEELTHGGRLLDDFEEGGWGGGGGALGDDDDDMDSGRIDANTVDRAHFGGFNDDERDPDAPERKKTKSEVMAEIIAKSKDHKYERQLAKEQDEATRAELDGEFGELRDLLMGLDSTAEEQDQANLDAGGSRSNLIPLGTRVTGFTAPKAEAATAEAGGEKEDYDAFVRSLAYDRRAKPTDRTKTEEELALEEKAELERLEQARLARMRGEEVDDETAGSSRKAARAARKRGADDLEDDFVGSGDEADEFGLGAGLASGGAANGDEMVALPGGSDSEMEDDEEAESGDEDDDEDGSDEDDMDDLEDGEGEAIADEDSDEADDAALAARSAPPIKKAPLQSAKTAATASPAPVRAELPFTFPMPSTHNAFLQLLSTHGVTSAADTALVVKRIRALYHPKLGEGNKERLQVFLTVLLDHVLDVLAPPAPAFDVVQELMPHLTALTTSFPLLAAQHTIAKLGLIQKNLTRGLARGPLDPQAKTWPGPQELGLLRVIGTTWSTSDFNHPVGRPAMLYIGQCLSQARVRGTRDLASGLFLCSLVLQYESLSKRYMPEVINFLALTVLLLAPHGFKTPATYPGLFPLTELDSDRYAPLKLKVKSTLAPSTPDLAALLTAGNDDDAGAEADLGEQAKTDLLATAMHLLSRFATLWASLDAFAEVYGPVVELLEGVIVKKLSPALRKAHASTLLTLSNQLRLYLQSRRPLKLQEHKPIPIPSYVPKFEGSHYTPGKHYDPDVERNNMAKLRKELKEEKKGAIRELRKDARFLSAERNRIKDEKDQAYEARMRSAHGAITVERGEEKAMEREKARDKRRAGK